ncbi:SCO family protein [Mucilaginibacter calamicampi]|uniref:SCO family protein n=1 Tax=Mucilaginibacter calamicampi TaxID=1302352 RepID=A0ABW2YXS6_9SPHI
MKSAKLLGFVLFLMAFIGCSQQQDNLPFYNTPDFTPVWLQPGDEGYDKIHTIPAFNFTDQLGEPVTNTTTAGKIYVANFFFASCKNVCPAMMDNLEKVQSAFKNNENVLILSHSVTPLKDNVPALKKYANDRHIDNKTWLLLTGDRDATYALARRAYFADEAGGYGKKPDEFLHTENVVLIDTKGRIRGVYNASLAVEIDMLVQDIKLLQKESA